VIDEGEAATEYLDVKLAVDPSRLGPVKEKPNVNVMEHRTPLARSVRGKGVRRASRETPADARGWCRRPRPLPPLGDCPVPC